MGRGLGTRGTTLSQKSLTYVDPSPSGRTALAFSDRSLYRLRLWAKLRNRQLRELQLESGRIQRRDRGVPDAADPTRRRTLR